MKININFNKIPPSYLFSDIGKKINAFVANNPNIKLIRLGIGDVTNPLVDDVVVEGKHALDLAGIENPGYPSGEGDKNVREAIKEVYYKKNSLISSDNIILSCGAKEDSANIQELFDINVPVYVTDPVYPVYLNSNILAGRNNIKLLPCTEENGFLPDIPDIDEPSVIYLCFPNNPTGECASYEYLERWVKEAIKSESVIVFDIAYVDFITDPNMIKSIYEIPGAEKVAIEIGSLSKSAGFTGVRVAFTTIPSDLVGYDDEKEHSFLDLWIRRQNFKMNGVSFVQQKMALAALTTARKDCLEQVQGYLENAVLISKIFTKIGLKCYGGKNSPYIWAKTPNNMGSWDFFDLLLNECGVVCTPGEGFGDCGKGYFRLSAFGDRSNVVEALERITTKLSF